MVYGNYGRINASNTTFKDPQTNILQQYNNNYTYNTVNPQSNSFAAESANNNNIMFEYGNNGSLRKRTDNALQKTEYYLFNAFDQMKAYSENGETYGYYGYDDAGQRTYKATLKNFVSRTNALGGKTLEVEKMMLYPNGYININQDGNYTKHYYADAARIASKIGNGFIDTANLYYSNSSAFLDSAMINELTELTGDTIESIDNKYDSLWLQIDTGKYEDALYYYHGNHLSSTQLITDNSGSISQAVLYTPFGQVISEYRQDWKLDTIPRFLFSAKELDEESGMYYFEARYLKDGGFISRDKLFEKNFFMSPYAYCGNNPVSRIDPTGMDWEDTDGKPVTDHSKIKVYIFYDPRSSDGGGGFADQTKNMAAVYEKRYGKGSVAMSNVTTMDGFAQDWGDMASPDIKAVNLNYHGSNQAIHLDNSKDQYITATGNGTLNKSGREGFKNVQDLPTPSGNISKAQLNLNTCSSNNRSQQNYPLKGSRLTLMQAFYKTFGFDFVRGCSGGVNYQGMTEPVPKFGTWDYMGNVPDYLKTPPPSMHGGFTPMYGGFK